MNPRDITILTSISPITIVKKGSKETYEALAKFLNNSKFVSFIQTYRMLCNLPKNGIDIREFEESNFSDLPVINNDYIKTAIELPLNTFVEKLGLANDFTPQLLLLTFFNAIIDIKYFQGALGRSIKAVFGKKNISSALFDEKYEIGAILIPYTVSQNKLIEWIKNNWSDIQKQIDNNLIDDPHMLKVHKNTELALEIVELKENQNKTFTQICDLLTQKYPEDERMMNDSTIKRMYYDYKFMYQSALIMKPVTITSHTKSD